MSSIVEASPLWCHKVRGGSLTIYKYTEGPIKHQLWREARLFSGGFLHSFFGIIAHLNIHISMNTKQHAAVMLQLEQYFNDEKVSLLKIPALFCLFVLFTMYRITIASHLSSGRQSSDVWLIQVAWQQKNTHHCDVIAAPVRPLCCTETPQQVEENDRTRWWRAPVHRGVAS